VIFNEGNTSEGLIIDTLRRLPGTPWRYVRAADLPRSETDVCVWPLVTEALIRLNPEIAAQPDRAEEVIYRLQAILHSGASNLVYSNEEFMSWLRGERSMPFGENHSHVPVRLIDFAQPGSNSLIVTNQYTYRSPDCP